MAGIQIFAAGRAGDGTGSHAGVLAWALKDMGAWTFTWKEEVYSNIYTREAATPSVRPTSPSSPQTMSATSSKPSTKAPYSMLPTRVAALRS